MERRCWPALCRWNRERRLAREKPLLALWSFSYGLKCREQLRAVDISALRQKPWLTAARVFAEVRP